MLVSKTSFLNVLAFSKILKKYDKVAALLISNSLFCFISSFMTNTQLGYINKEDIPISKLDLVSTQPSYQY